MTPEQHQNAVDAMRQRNLSPKKDCGTHAWSKWRKTATMIDSEDDPGKTIRAFFKRVCWLCEVFEKKEMVSRNDGAYKKETESL